MFVSDVVTAFHFTFPNDTIQNGEYSVDSDNDGDLIVSRKGKHSEGVIKIGRCSFFNENETNYQYVNKVSKFIQQFLQVCNCH